MGFNTVRLMGAEVKKDVFDGIYFPACSNPPCNVYDDRFVSVVKTNASYSFVEYLPPYNSNASLQTLLAAIEDVLNKATEEGLKVILITGGGNYLLNHLKPPYGSTTANDDDVKEENATDYADILATYTTYFKNNTTLLGYDLWNEPGHWNNPPFTHSKQQLCKWSKMWYDQIKQSNVDPNHLITMGTFTFGDLFYWDLALLKLDFVSPHIYPFVSPVDAHNEANTLNRYYDNIVWLQNNCPLPWIIGETSFRSQAETYLPDKTAILGGTPTQQADFAQESLNGVRNAGGSGYSWWQFSDTHGDYFGLIGDVDPVNGMYTNGVKPVAQIFTNYLSSTGASVLNGTANRSAGYYDPYQTGVSNPSHHNAITGTVVDANGLIVDAYIEALNWLENIDDLDGNTSNDIPKTDWLYSFSNPNNGTFTIIPYNRTIPGDDRIIYFKCTALGRDKVGSATWPVNPSQAVQIANPGFIALNSITSFAATTLVEGEFVSTTQNFPGGNTLTIKNSIITANGESDITAKDEINVNNEFYAQYGSETHIYTKINYADCIELDNFRSPVTNNNESADNETKKNTGNIELVFKKNVDKLIATVLPNPAEGIFKIKVEEAEPTETKIKVFDYLGNLVKNITSFNAETAIDATNLAKGIYYIIIENRNKTTTKKLIII